MMLIKKTTRKELIASGDSWTGGSRYQQKDDPFGLWELGL